MNETKNYEVIAKGTFLHADAGKIYEELAAGKKIKSPVVFRDNKAFIEAAIDVNGAYKVLGNVETEGFEVPNIYTASIKGPGADPKSFVIEVNVAEGLGASSGGYVTEDAVNAGFTQEEVDQRVKYMTEEGFHPSVINAALKFLAEYGNPRHSVNIGPDEPLYRKVSDDSPTEAMVMAAVTQTALILFGEKSTGKNVASHTVAWLLGQPEYRIGFQRDMGIDDVFGGKGTDNSAAEKLDQELALAKLLYDADPVANANYAEDAAKFELLKAQSASIRVVQNESAIIKWAKGYEDENDLPVIGGVMMFDEVNMAHANLLQAIMNPLADGDKTLVIPGVGRVKLHPSCILFAGMNPGYAGTMELNDATASRCGFYEFTVPKSIKPQLIENFPPETVKLIKRHIDACDRLYKDFRAAASQTKVSSKCLNIRGFVNALKQAAKFPEACSLKKQLQIYVINACPEDERLVLNAMLNDKISF